MMCKHYNTPQGCTYGDKCQFAHGPQELRAFNGQITQDNTMEMTKNQKSMINYKIVKCKNWEKDGTCKYGNHCTFAHGDTDLRDKTSNLYQMQQMTMAGQIDPNQLMMGVNMNPQGIDMNIPQFTTNNGNGAMNNNNNNNGSGN